MKKTARHKAKGETGGGKGVRWVIGGILVFVGGSLIVTLVLPIIERRLMLWEDKRLNLVCESTSERNTYEIPYHYSKIGQTIPVKVKWLSRVSQETIQIEIITADGDRLTPKELDIDTKKQKRGSDTLKLPLNIVADRYLGFDRSHVGEQKSFELVADLDGERSSKKVNAIYVPWGHIPEIPFPLVYTNEPVECVVKIANHGTDGDFVVMYEAYPIVNDREGDWIEGRTGVDVNDKNKIHVPNGEEVQLKPQIFQFESPGEYFIKTYAIKYQEYLMRDWDFWSKETITVTDISLAEQKNQIETHYYSDSHRLSWIRVINYPVKPAGD